MNIRSKFRRSGWHEPLAYLTGISLRSCRRYRRASAKIDVGHDRKIESCQICQWSAIG